MKLFDVNILIHCHRRDAENHQAYFSWLQDCFASHEPFAVPSIVMSGFLRVVTHAAMYKPATTIADAIEFAEGVRKQANFVEVAPGPRHWEIFAQLCLSIRASGKLIPDAYIAAMALESGCEVISADRDFARFPGLRWRHPLKAK